VAGSLPNRRSTSRWTKRESWGSSRVTQRSVTQRSGSGRHHPSRSGAPLGGRHGNCGAKALVAAAVVDRFGRTGGVESSWVPAAQSLMVLLAADISRDFNCIEVATGPLLQRCQAGAKQVSHPNLRAVHVQELGERANETQPLSGCCARRCNLG
jgi:hypothetical protein